MLWPSLSSLDLFFYMPPVPIGYRQTKVSMAWLLSGFFLETFRIEISK